MTTEQQKQTLDMWVILELMGHQRMAGRLREVTVAGHGFLRIDVPDTGVLKGYTRMVAPSSVYAINPTTEDLARRAAAAFQPKPVQEWELPKALPEPAKDHSWPERDGACLGDIPSEHDEDD